MCFFFFFGQYMKFSFIRFLYNLNFLIITLKKILAPHLLYPPPPPLFFFFFWRINPTQAWHETAILVTMFYLYFQTNNFYQNVTIIHPTCLDSWHILGFSNHLVHNLTIFFAQVLHPERMVIQNWNHFYNSLIY